MNLNRRAFLKSTTAAAIAAATSVRSAAKQRSVQDTRAARLQLIRHATCVVHYGGRVLLVDPMLGDPGVMPPIANTPNPRRNPLVALPTPAERLLTGVDAILVTHTHADHWDAAATQLVPKGMRLFIQPPDAPKFTQWNFTNVDAIDARTTWNGIEIVRTGGQHGRGAVGQKLAPVSGFVLRSAGFPTLYVAGDTVWCPEVADAIKAHQPQVIVVNAGAAQFVEGGPITMDATDVIEVCRAAPKANVIAVHMEAINHCILTRAALREALQQSPGQPSVRIPRDGEGLQLS